MKLRSGKILHKFNVHAKEFTPKFNVHAKEFSPKVNEFTPKVIDITPKVNVHAKEFTPAETLYLNTQSGQHIYILANIKNMEKMKVIQKI
jgi:hypothetical protein